MGNYIATRYDTPGSYHVKSFYYYRDDNILVDDDGNIIYDIFRYITPSEYRLFKERQGTYYVNTDKDKGLVYEFVYPEDFINDDYH